MAIGDLIKSTVETRYKADTSDHKRAVRQLRGEQRKAAKEQLSEMERQNAAIDKQIARWAKAGVAVGAMVGAWQAAQASVDSYIKNARLAEATAGLSISNLQKATRGLVEETDLMTHAAKLQGGQWKLNQQEIEVVLKGTDALRRKLGDDMVPTLEKVTESLKKGTTEELKQFGIEAKTKQGVLAEFRREFEQFGSSSDAAGDAFRRSQVSFANAIDNIKSSIGELVVSMAPLVHRLAQVVELIEEAKHLLPPVPGDRGIDNAGNVLKAANEENRRKALGIRTPIGSGGSESLDFGSVFSVRQDGPFGQANHRAFMMLDRGMSLMSQGFREMAQSGAGGKGGAGGGKIDVVDMSSLNQSIGGGGAFTGSLGAGGGIDGIDSAFSQDQFDRARDDDKYIREQMASHIAFNQELLAQQAEAEARANIFKSVFGDPNDISATSVALGQAQMAVGGLSSALAESFEVWAKSGDSAIDAFRRVTGGVVNAMGDELAAVAAKHAVLAAVAAVTFNWAEAGKHAAAAGVAGLGSFAMYKIAGELGYKEGANAATAQTAGAGAGGGAGSFLPRSGRIRDNRGETERIVMVDASMYGLTEGQRAHLLAEQVRRGNSNRSANIVRRH